VTTIDIVVEGGVVVAVDSSDPDVRVEVFDYDWADANRQEALASGRFRLEGGFLVARLPDDCRRTVYPGRP
jgi:putative sterol carrier protein